MKRALLPIIALLGATVSLTAHANPTGRFNAGILQARVLAGTDIPGADSSGNACSVSLSLANDGGAILSVRKGDGLAGLFVSSEGYESTQEIQSNNLYTLTTLATTTSGASMVLTAKLNLSENSIALTQTESGMIINETECRLDRNAWDMAIDGQATE